MPFQELNVPLFYPFEKQTLNFLYEWKLHSDAYSIPYLLFLPSGLPCLPEQKPFRDGYLYSNVLYSLAGHVIEKLTNESFAQALKSRLLAPLGMTHTEPYLPGKSELPQTNEPSLGNARVSSAVPYVVVKDRLVPAHPSLFR